MAMLTFNGKRFARNKREYESQTDNSGYYKIKRGGDRVAILLMDSTKEPKALISPDGCTVTASRQDDGKTFYMFSTTKETNKFLGLDESIKYSALMDMGRAAIREAKQQIDVATV